MGARNQSPEQRREQFLRDLLQDGWLNIVCLYYASRLYSVLRKLNVLRNRDYTRITHNLNTQSVEVSAEAAAHAKANAQADADRCRRNREEVGGCVRVKRRGVE